MLASKGPRIAAVLGGSRALGPRIALSNASILESAEVGDEIGTLSVRNGIGDYTFSITADPDEKFAIDGDALKLADTVDFETATSHSVTIEADNGVDDPITRTFTISVINVLETTLNELSLDIDEIEEGSAEDTVVGELQDVTSGSTLSMVDTAGGRFKLSGTNVVAGAVQTDFETATSHNITIRETHPDAEPRNSIITITVTNALEVTLNALTLDHDEITEGAAENTVVGALQGLTSGSSISMTDDAEGRFKLSGTNVVAASVATDFEAAQSHQITVRETHADGSNSPRDSVIDITVVNVLEATLNALTLDNDEIEEGSEEDTVVGALQGVTSGSSLSMPDTAGGRFKLSGTNIVAGAVPTDFEIATSHAVTVRETHADGINSPRDSVITITVTDVDEVAPTLANPVADATSDTEADLSVDTDEDNGTLYWVVTTSATPPSAAQIIAGDDHTDADAVAAGDQAVEATGTQVIEGGVTGLTADTQYWAYFVQVDDANNVSNVVGDDFVTDEAPVEETEITFVGAASLSHASRTNSTIPLPDGVQVGDWVGIGLVAITLGGAAPSVDWGDWGEALVTPIAIANSGDEGLYHCRGKFIDEDDVSAGEVVASHATTITNAAVLAFRATGPISVSATSNNGTGTTTTWTGVNLGADGSAVALFSVCWDGGGSLTPPTGFTEDVDIVTAYAAHQLDVAAGPTGNPSHTNANGGGTPWAAVLVALEPE